MKTKILLSITFGFILSVQIFAQNNSPDTQGEQTNQTTNSIDKISSELITIANSLQVFNKNFKAFLERLPQGIKFSEKQQNLLLGFEILNRAEERVQILQKFQIDLTDKQATVKNRLAQIDQEITPEGLDRFVSLLGTTKTEEYRESQRRTLDAERTSLKQLNAQINQNLSDTNEELRQAVSFVTRLREKILPQIEQEMSNM